MALKAVKGALDSDSVRREDNRLMNEPGARLNTWRFGFEENVT